MNRKQIILLSATGVSVLAGGIWLFVRNRKANAWNRLSDEEKKVQMDYWRDGLQGWKRGIKRARTSPVKITGWEDWHIDGHEANPAYDFLTSDRKISSDAHYQAKKQGKYIPVGHEVRRNAAGEYELRRIPSTF